MKALFWWAVRKRVRSWNLLTKAASASRCYYRKAIESYEIQVKNGLKLRNLDQEPSELNLTCIVYADQPEVQGALKISLDSIQASFGRNAPVIVVRTGDDLNSISRDTADWVLPMQAGDRIADHAGRLLGAAMAEAGEGNVIYWDEDIADGGQREDPWFKPSWDPILFLARDYLSGSAIVRVDAFVDARSKLIEAGIALDQPESLSVALASDPLFSPRHLPFVLTHRRGVSHQNLELRQQWFDRLWPEKTVLTESSNPYFAQIALADPVAWPTVSIIIPTRDRSDLLRSCMDGLAKLTYRGAVEILVVDNGSSDRATLDLLSLVSDREDVTVIRDEGAFNFSRLNNLAAQQATGEFLCLLNNDVEPVDGEWLTEMMRYAARPATGAVGAMLLYPDGSIQHAGVAVGLGGAAGHTQRYAAPADPRNFSWHGISRSVSVVTAACLLLRTSDYLAVGGLDEGDFGVAFNDVDLCLRLAEAGRTNIYAASARLIHHESLSRGSDFDPANRQRFERELQALRSKWKTNELQDQYYHPIFSRTAEQCVPAL